MLTAQMLYWYSTKLFYGAETASHRPWIQRSISPNFIGVLREAQGTDAVVSTKLYLLQILFGLLMKNIFLHQHKTDLCQRGSYI